MTTASYHIGDLRTLSVAFTDSNGAAFDPDTVTFKMTEPDGTTTSYVEGVDGEAVKDSVGNYHVDWTLAQAGRHHIRWEGTGALATAEPDEIYALRKATA